MCRKRRAAIFLLAVFLTGCMAGQDGTDGGQIQEPELLEAANSENGEPEENSVEDMETEPEPADEAPASVPGICVNRLGYITKSTKTAVFFGPELPEEFFVVNADSGEKVFTGQLENEGYDGISEEYNGSGDFSQVQESGIYYIEAPVLGKSCIFEIGDTLYEDALWGLIRQYGKRRGDSGSLTGETGGPPDREEPASEGILREDPSVSVDISGGWHQEDSGKRSVTDAARETAVLLMACELNGDSFAKAEKTVRNEDDLSVLLEEIRYEVEWLLKMQDKETGAVYAGLTPEKQEAEKEEILYVEPADPVSAEAFAMALARFSYLYQDYDTEFATECLKAADRAWKYAELNGIEETEGWRFAAAAELYRASGGRSFRDCVRQYLSEEDFQGNMEESVLLGGVTYLSTRQPVELALCEELTRALMARADQAAVDARESYFPIGESKPDGDCRKLLEDGMYLCLANHMVSSREYELVVENSLHYLMGRNRQSVNYLDGEEGKLPEEDKMIFLLSEVLCWQREHEQ